MVALPIFTVAGPRAAIGAGIIVGTGERQMEALSLKRQGIPQAHRAEQASPCRAPYSAVGLRTGARSLEEGQRDAFQVIGDPARHVLLFL